MVSGGALVITTVEGWLLAPLWMGKAERLHVIVIYVGLLLWTWSWGAGGTILAVPRLRVAQAVADHVEP